MKNENSPRSRSRSRSLDWNIEYKLAQFNSLAEQLQKRHVLNQRGICIITHKKNPRVGAYSFFVALSVVWDFGISVFRLVPACRGNLRALIQRGLRVCSEDGKLFCKTEVAVFCATFVRVRLGMDAPCNGVRRIFVLEAPDVLG